MGSNGSKLGSMVSLPVAVLLAIMFFLPWLSVRCAGQEVANATGWQLTSGDASPSKALAGQPGQDRPCDSVDARPWFILGLLVPLAVLAVGWRGFTDAIHHATAGRWLIGLGVLGLIVMILAANVSYADDMTGQMKAKCSQRPAAAPGQCGAPGPEMDAAMDQMASQMAEGISNAIETRPTGALWLSIALYAVVVTCGLGNLFLPSPAEPFARTDLPPQPVAAGADWPAAPAQPAQPAVQPQ